jgi:membrane-associated phospholipid phosphatase
MRSLFRNYTFVDYATQGYSAIVALFILCFHNHTVPHWQLLVLAHVVIFLIIQGLVNWQAKRPGIPALDFFRFFYPVPFYIWFFAETGWLNRMFVTEFIDPPIARLEQALFGGQPSVLFMHKLPYLIVSEVLYTAYFSYYLMIAGIGIALFIRNRKEFFHFVSVVSFIFYVCYLLYLFLPIAGPRTFFHEFPDYKFPPEIQALAVTDTYPDNVRSGPMFRVMAFIYRHFEAAPGASLPSSHVAIALCTVWFSFRYLRSIRYLHLVMAVLLCLATVYAHYHYVLDMLTGVLTAVVLIPVANWLYARYGPKEI